MTSTLSNKIDLSLDEIIANKSNSGAISLKSKSRREVGNVSLDDIIKERQVQLASLVPAFQQTSQKVLHDDIPRRNPKTNHGGLLPTPFTPLTETEQPPSLLSLNLQHVQNNFPVNNRPLLETKKPPSLLSLNVQHRQGNFPINASSSRLVIKNLHPDVNDDDVSKLFSQFGPVLKSAVHFDQYGTSLEMATIEFHHKSHAEKAIRKYNNIPLDGRPMKIRFDTDDDKCQSKQDDVFTPNHALITRLAPPVHDGLLPTPEVTNFNRDSSRSILGRNSHLISNQRDTLSRKRVLLPHPQFQPVPSNHYHKSKQPRTSHTRPLLAADLDKQLSSYIAKRPVTLNNIL